jgi:hypothetical protein
MSRPVKARRLTPDEGQYLLRLVRRGRHDSVRYRRALIIMASDEDIDSIVAAATTRPKRRARSTQAPWPSGESPVLPPAVNIRRSQSGLNSPATRDPALFTKNPVSRRPRRGAHPATPSRKVRLRRCVSAVHRRSRGVSCSTTRRTTIYAPSAGWSPVAKTNGERSATSSGATSWPPRSYRRDGGRTTTVTCWSCVARR